MDFYFSIAAIIAQIYNPTADLVIPIEILAKSELEINPVTIEDKIIKRSL